MPAFVVLFLLINLQTTKTPVGEDNIVVTGTRQSVQNNREIKEKELDEKGVMTVTDALSFVPDVQIMWSPKSGASLSLQGFDERYSLITIAGIPVHESYAGHFDIQGLGRGMFSSIIVETGVVSLLYGPGVSAGLVRMETARRCSAYSGSITVRTGNFHRNFTPDLFASGNICFNVGNFMITGGISHQRSDGYSLPSDFPVDGKFSQFHEDGGIRNGSKLQRTGFSIAARGNFTASDRLDFFISMVDSPRQIPPFESQEYVRYWSFSDYSSIFGGGRYRRDFHTPSGKKISSEFSIFGHFHTDNLDDHGNPSYAGLTHDTLAWFAQSAYRNFSSGEHFSLHFEPFKRFSFTAKAIHRLDIHHQKERRIDGAGEIQEWTPWEKYSSQMFAGVVSSVYRGKYFKIEFEGLFSGMNVLSQEIRGIEYETTKRVMTGPEGRIYAQFGTDVLNAGIEAGHKVRFPTLKELFTNRLGGNPDLEPENINMVSLYSKLEIKRRHFNMRISGNLFYYLIDDMILKPRDAYENTGEARMRGVSLQSFVMLKRRCIFPFKTALAVSYRFIDADDLSENRPLDYLSRHTVITSMAVYPVDSVHFGIQHRYASAAKAWWYDTLSSAWITDVMPSGNIFSAQLRWRFYHTKELSLVWFVEGSNITDTIYMSGSLEARPGRTFFTGFQGRFR